MAVVKVVLIVIYVIVCLALIILALMQSKEDAGMSGTITGSSTTNFYEKNKGRLKKWTIILGIVFAIITIILSIIYIV